MSGDLHVRVLGVGAPVLVLLHGLGVNGAVWDPMLAKLGDWPGRIIVPDLRGHGRSPHATFYSDQSHAGDVAGLVRGAHDVHVIGHSMGGMIALVLANGTYQVDIASVFAFGVKTVWSDDDLFKLLEFAQKPARRFATVDEARERFLRTTGLKGLVDADAPVVEAGVMRDGEGYRLAADPRTVMVVGSSASDRYRSAKVPCRLAAGSNDALVTIEQLRTIDNAAIVLGTTGHNAHVEDPAALIRAAPFLAKAIA